ncbi:MAG: hypothetical protein EBZ77_05950, partial [Chitinophagia bacterium]|nr:hypothetical protein [Chitinophagia bacterium]
MLKNCLPLLALLATLHALAQQPTVLPNGWKISPAGTSVPLYSDFPMYMAVSPDGRYLAITNNGVSAQSLQLVSARTRRVLHTLPINKAWLGLAFSADARTLYASGGNDNRINLYRVAHDSLALCDSIILGKPWPEKISPAGLVADDNNQRLYVVTKENNALYVINLVTRKVIRRVPLSAEGYTCLLSPDRHYLYITLWGGKKVVRYDTRLRRITDSVNVGTNPNDICQSHDGRYLYVANAVDNTVSVIATAPFRVVETLNAALYPDAPAGSTTNSVCLSPNGKQLYIANA